MTSELLTNVVEFLSRYVVLSGSQADALALFVAHTHTFDAAEATPYIAVTSAEKRSGKTRLLEVLETLVAHPWLTGRVTAAVLVRKVDARRPTLLLDESDAAFSGPQEYAETLRGILNTGYRRGGRASVCVGAGANIGFRDFQTFCPKAIAGLGRLPDTVADRSISISLMRRAPGEVVQRFRRREAERKAQPLRDALAASGAGAVQVLTAARPDLPRELDDRAADCWEPLLAIADFAGGDWPARARAAARALSAQEREDDSVGVRLLADIHDIFGSLAQQRVARTDLVEALVALEDAPWGDLRGKALDGRLLGRLLRPFGIRSRTVRLSTTRTAHGFQREQFNDAWRRYLPSHASHVAEDDSSRVTPTEPAASSVSRRPNTKIADQNRDVIDVTSAASDYVFDGEDDPDVELARIVAKFGAGAFSADGRGRDD